jgi:CBS domain-containing protein
MQRQIVPDVVSEQTLVGLAPTASVLEAASMMRDRHIGAILVMDQGKLLGIFTERDMVCRVVAERLDPETTVLRDVMTPDPDTLTPNQQAGEALEMMGRRGYRHLPVVRDGNVIGIVSVRDLFAAVRSELEEEVQTREAFMFDTGYG